MQAVPATVVAFLMALVLSPTAAEARSANTERIVGNVEIALSSVTLVEAYATATIPEKERQTATNLLRDVDYALRRATGDLGRVPADEQDAEVKALMKRVADLTIYRDKLAKNLEASVKGGAELDKQYRAYREDIKPYKTAVAAFTIRPGSTQQYANFTAENITVGLERLAKLHEMCTTKYKGLEFNDRLGFQLGVDPTTDCSIAAKRLEIATTLVETGAAQDIEARVKQIDGARTGLEAADGHLRGLIGTHDLVFNTAKGTADLQARHEPKFKAIGKSVPAGFTTPITTAVTALWAEIDRLAPTYEFPKKLAHDGPAEAGAKKEVARIFDGAKVMKSGMEFAQWSVAKNNLDIPTETYRSGIVLTKSKADKWCVLRGFTAHKTYIGGGKFQSTMTFTFDSSRFQKCN
jgi:hypothetical protein